MTPPLLIRKATLADEPRIALAWEQAYGDMAHYKYPDRWRWNILGNPYVEETHKPLVWIATDGDAVVAWTSAFVVPLIAAGQNILGAHSVDTYTLPEFRGHGFGQKLQELNQEAHPIFIAIDPSPANRRNKYRVGGWPGKPLYTYLKLLDSLDGPLFFASALDAVETLFGHTGRKFFSLIGSLGAKSLTSLMFSKGLELRQTLAVEQEIAPAELYMEEIATFGSESDTLWDQAAPAFSFAVRRDAAYLNWKYNRHPHLRYRKFLARQKGQAVGLLIYRFATDPPEQRATLVSECFCANDDPALYAAMLSHVEADSMIHAMPMIRCGASTPNLQQALGTRRFVTVDIDVPVLHLSPDCPEIDQTALLSGEWLLSLGDSDLDQVRVSHQPTFVELLRLFLGRIPGEENIPRP